MLCIETTLLLHISLNVFPFYLLVFFCTCIYYTTIYVRSAHTKNPNERTFWYRKNLAAIKKVLRLSGFVVFFLLLLLIALNFPAVFSLSLLQYLLLIFFPFIAAWYTFSSHAFKIKNIRQTGWIKPFVVGFTWAGWVTIYPLFVSQIQNRKLLGLQMFSLLLLWLQNFLFFSINAVLFDVKDYRTDSYHRLNTYPVMFGVRNTFRFIIAPLVIINLIVFFLFQRQQNFSVLQTIIQLIPYLLLMGIIISHKVHRSLLYYLAAVDGLVFAKAVCGIASMLLF